MKLDATITVEAGSDQPVQSGHSSNPEPASTGEADEDEKWECPRCGYLNSEEHDPWRCANCWWGHRYFQGDYDD